VKYFIFFIFFFQILQLNVFSQEKNISIIKANSFDLIVESFLSLKIKNDSLIRRTAAVQFNKDDKKFLFKVFFQNGKYYENNELKTLALPESFYEEHTGGVKSVFTIDNIDFALISNKINDCFYASILRLNPLKELLKSECLPKNEEVDFNGLGGAVITYNDYLYISIGTPEGHSQKIRELAQSKKSIFGKILKISKKDLLKNNDGKLKYTIFSLGHRNPQGMVEIQNNIFSIEHGPQGGDEINIIQFGKNYGWPLKSYGTRYLNGKSFKYNKKILNYKSPIYSFVPSIAPSSLSQCPENLQEFYNENICLISLSLKTQSIFVILLNSNNYSVQSIEAIKIGRRLRHFAVDNKIKTYTNNNYFFISSDGKGEIKIAKLLFSNFR